MFRSGLTRRLLLSLILTAACLYGIAYCQLDRRAEAPQSAAPKAGGEQSPEPPPPPLPKGGGGGGGSLPLEPEAPEKPEEPEKQEPPKELKVDRQLAQLQSRLSFNTPEQMQMGESTRIVLVLGRTGTPQEKTPGEMEGEVRQQGGKKGPIAAVEDVPSTEKMRARLTGT